MKLSLLAAGCGLCLVLAGTALASKEDAGKEIYDRHCSTCHAAGVAGAPKLGDTKAWQPLIARGMDQLLQTAKTGKGAMPPMGTCSECSMEDLEDAVEYMVEQSR